MAQYTRNKMVEAMQVKASNIDKVFSWLGKQLVKIEDKNLLKLSVQEATRAVMACKQNDYIIMENGKYRPVTKETFETNFTAV